MHTLVHHLPSEQPFPENRAKEKKMSSRLRNQTKRVFDSPHAWAVLCTPSLPFHPPTVRYGKPMKWGLDPGCRVIEQVHAFRRCSLGRSIGDPAESPNHRIKGDLCLCVCVWRLALCSLFFSPPLSPCLGRSGRGRAACRFLVCKEKKLRRERERVDGEIRRPRRN